MTNGDRNLRFGIWSSIGLIAVVVGLACGGAAQQVVEGVPDSLCGELTDRSVTKPARRAQVALMCEERAFQHIKTGRRPGAVPYFEKACDYDRGGACHHLGMLFDEGKGGVARDEARRDTAWKRACELNDPVACHDLGREVVKSDPDRARDLYERGCAVSNDGQVCNSLASLMQAQEPENAAKLFAQACEMGSVAACYNLAIAYRLGKGVTQDQARAREEADRLCGNGFPRACSLAGVMTWKGEGGPVNDVQGVAHFERGCALNAPMSCYQLGDALNQGRGIAKDESRALSEWKKACDGGLELACRPNPGKN